MRSAPLATDIDHWLARLEPAQCMALEKLRAALTEIGFNASY